MESTWVFRDYETDEEINAALCSLQTEVEGVALVGPACGYEVRWMTVEPDGEDVIVMVYIERPLKVTSTVLMDGRVIN